MNKLLVIENAGIDSKNPNHVSGIVNLGGHTVRVVLDYGTLKWGVEFVKMPFLLELHQPSKQAVIKTFERIYKGEKLNFPVDLTPDILDAKPPSPFLPASNEKKEFLEKAASSSVIEVVKLELEKKEPPLFNLLAKINNRMVEVRAELYYKKDSATFLRVLSPVSQYELTAGEMYAIQKLLVDNINLAEIPEKDQRG